MNQRVDLGGFALNVEIDGDGDAPWLVLSNSLGASVRMWDPQMPLLMRQFRVLRYDTRGHGASGTPPGPWSWGDLTGDVIALMDHFGIERATFMGLSMGGMTGLGLALDHAGRIGRVVCADARADAPPPFQQMWDDRMALVQAGGLGAIADATLASWFTADWLAEHADQAAQVRAMVLATPRDGYLECCKTLKTLDYLRRLDQIKCPVLYVGGDQDKGAAPAVMTDMAQRTPNGRYQVIADAAHVANINRPQAFDEAVIGFLTQG